MNPISKYFRVYRYDKNLTQEQLAELLGVSVGYLGRVERGMFMVPARLSQRLYSILNTDEKLEFDKVYHQARMDKLDIEMKLG